jgi:hypothetical protein
MLTGSGLCPLALLLLLLLLLLLSLRDVTKDGVNSPHPELRDPHSEAES